MAIHGVSSDNGLTVVLDTSLSPSHSRSFQVAAPRSIAALAKGRAEFDQAKRVEIYRDKQRAAIEEVPLVPAFFPIAGNRCRCLRCEVAGPFVHDAWLSTDDALVLRDHSKVSWLCCDL